MELEINELFAEDPDILALLQEYEKPEIPQEDFLNEEIVVDFSVGVIETELNTEEIEETNTVEETEENIPGEELVSQSTPTGGNRKKNIISNVIFYGILSAFLLACVFFALSKNTKKSILGFRIYNVLTESMTPKYKAGDMIVVKIVKDVSRIKKEDVITFVPPGDRDDVYLTHRVQKISETDKGEAVFVTKGDANSSADPFEIPGKNVIGKVVFRVPAGGGLMSFIQKNLILTILFIASVFCLMLLLQQIIKKKKM